MKAFLLITVLAITVLASVNSLNTPALFSSAVYDATVGDYYVQSPTTGADTLESYAVNLSDKATGAMGLDIAIKDVSGGVSVDIQAGIYVGAGVGDSNGYKWFDIETVSAAGDYHYDIGSYSFASRPYKFIKFRFAEKSPQENKYFVWVHYEVR